MSLSDRIKQSAKNRTAPQSPSTKGVLDQLSAQATGKAQTPVASGQSNIAETAAVIEGQEQQRAQAEQLQQAATDAGMQEQAAQQQREQQQRERKLMEDQLNQQRADNIDKLLSVTQSSDADLEDRKDAHNLEMLGMELALQDRQYTDKIKDIGRRDRLEDKLKFSEEALRTQLGNNTKMLLDNIANTKIEGATARDFKESNMIEDLNSANDLINSMLADQRQATMIGGIAGLAGAGIDAYTYSKKEKPNG